MRRLARELADDFPRRGPRFDVFFALVNLSGYLRKPWVICSQAKLLERIRGNSGHSMSRRTLNRHLNAMERLRIINRTKRHQRDGRGGLRLRPTLYTFAELGVLWISRIKTAAQIPLGRLAVPKMAQRRNPLYLDQCPHCGKTIHSAGTATAKSSPPLRGGTDGPPNTGAMRERRGKRASKRLSREEAQIARQLEGIDE